MYHSPDTPEHIKQLQQQIWLSKPIADRITISLQMIEDARLLQIHGIKMRYPDFTDTDIRIFQLKRLLKNYPTLTWITPIIQELERNNA